MDAQFLWGFLVGQIALILMVVGLVQFLFMRGPFDLRHRSKGTSLQPLPPSENASQSTQLSQTELLNELNYSFARPESCHWLSVLAAQFLQHLRSNTHHHAQLTQHLLSTLHSSSASAYLTPLQIHHLSLGTTYPRFSRARIGLNEEGKLKLDVDVDWSGDIASLAFDTCLLINWPAPNMAGLPVSLSLSLTRLKCTLSLALSPREISIRHPRKMAVRMNLGQQFDLDVDVKSLLGEKTKLKDLVKVGEMVKVALREGVERTLVWPRSQEIIIDV